MLPAQSWVQGVQGAVGSAWQSLGHSRAWGVQRDPGTQRETQGPTAMQEPAAAEHRERLPPGACRKEEMKGSRGSAASPRRTPWGMCGLGRGAQGVTGHAGLGGRARPSQQRCSALPGSPGTSAVRPGLGPGEGCRGERWHSCSWERSSGQGRVTGASLQRRGKPGNHLTCKQHGATRGSAVSWPQQHPSEVCGRWDCSGPAGCWEVSQQGLLLGLQGALPHSWHPGAPRLQGTGEAHRSSQGQDRGQTCRARALAGGAQHPCHMWEQAVHQIPNLAPSSLPIRVGQAP